MSCPVAREIDLIRKGGVAPDEEDDAAGRIKLGGDTIEYICDTMRMYIMTRRLMLARYELRRDRPDIDTAMYEEMFKNIAGRNYGQIYTHLLDNSVKREFIYRQFTGLIDLIGVLEQSISMRVEAAAREGRPINVTLPDIILLPNIDMIVMYRPDVLCKTMNRIIDYMNLLNVDSLIRRRKRDKPIPHLAEFDGPALNAVEMVPRLIASIDSFAETMRHEMIVAAHVMAVEKYHCVVINHMNQVYDACKKIIDALRGDKITRQQS